MKTILEKITGNIIVNENTTFHNAFVESIIVEKGITARLYGSVDKEIVVKENAIAYLHGPLLGKVNNQGGTIYVFRPNGKIDSFESSI
jgi:hypothetical protein